MFSLIPDKHKMYMDGRKGREELIEFRGWKTIVRVYFILAPFFNKRKLQLSIEEGTEPTPNIIDMVQKL